VTGGSAGSGPGGPRGTGDADREPPDSAASGANHNRGELGEDPGEGELGADHGDGELGKASAEDPAGGQSSGDRDAGSGGGGEASAGGQGELGKASAEDRAGGQSSGDRDRGSGDGGEPSTGGQSSGDRHAGSGDGGEASAGRDVGGADHDERLAADSDHEAGAHGAYAVETPEQLLGEVKAVRRRTRFARHAYWFPLVLFGLLTCASIPFYLQPFPATGWYGFSPISGPVRYLNSDYLGGFGYLAYYWLAAILVGLTATALWYRLRGDRVGLRTPSRGFVITGLVLLVLALVIPVLAALGGVARLAILMPGDLLARGTFPFVLIGIGLCVLAWAERSVALTVIAAGYLALSLVASLYDIQNVVYRLGWNLGPTAAGLPNVVLPALVLLLSGAGAWVVQRRRRPRPAGPSDKIGPAATRPVV
jgi:hypothetical protein